MQEGEYIDICKASVHNLKDISLRIPRHALVVVTGLSGSGKSSLAFDTIYAEARRRYMDTLSAYARHYIGVMERPEVESIEGLSPTIAIEQKSTNRNPALRQGIYGLFSRDRQADGKIHRLRHRGADHEGVCRAQVHYSGASGQGPQGTLP